MTLKRSNVKTNAYDGRQPYSYEPVRCQRDQKRIRRNDLSIVEEWAGVLKSSLSESNW